MREVGLPDDIIMLINSWLANRTAYVEVGNESSYFYDITKGTVQGSVMGPFLFAIYVKNMLELEPVTVYADDNYLI